LPYRKLKRQPEKLFRKEAAESPYGIAAGWCGGLAAEDVINAWPLDRLTEFLRAGRPQH